MKTEQLLIYGGLAVAAYYLIKSKSAAPAASYTPTLTPATTAAIQPVSQAPNLSTLLATGGNFLKSILPAQTSPLLPQAVDDSTVYTPAPTSSLPAAVIQTNAAAAAPATVYASTASPYTPNYSFSTDSVCSLMALDEE